jgi:multiple sugar transport system ATP-binding protein
VIEFRQVSRRFGPGAPALDALDLDIPEGERVVVLGPSGSGKTTLLRLIAGLESPDGGTILIGGKDMHDVPPHRRDVGLVFQTPALYPHLNVFENLAFGLRARRMARTERKRRVGEVAEILGLETLMGRRTWELSGGERQRVALGRAVARRPAVLLLDEPFSSLDEPLRAALRTEVVELHRRFGSTLVHVTHDQGEAMSLGQRLAVLHQGRLMQYGPPREIYDRPAHRFVASFVGSPGMNLLSVDAGPGDDLGIRPEAIAVAPESGQVAPSDHVRRLSAVIHRVEYQGDAVLATLSAGTQTLVAKLPAAGEFEEGQKVEAALDLSRASWFDRATGLRREPIAEPQSRG